MSYIVEALNTTARPYRQGVRVHELFEAQVNRSPDAAALEFCGAQISYAALNSRANRLARHLRTLGVVAGSHVGICADRSFELIVGILAVLKAGGGFVPLDPEYPDDRLTFMLTDCAALVVLTTRATANRVPRSGATVVELDTVEPQLSPLPDANLSPLGSPEEVAYTLYTSGSTGRPKGVLIPHRGICNHMQWVCDELELSAADRLLQFTSISFDAAMLELLAPLHCGAMLVLASPGRHRDPGYLISTIREHGITVFQLVPSLLRVLVGIPAFRGCTSLRHLISGGEALTWELARSARAQLPGTALRNCYGPTEASVDATSVVVDDVLAQATGADGVVPIGRPIANATAYVLDENLRPVEVGEKGELFIGGAGLALGYLNREELTRERFVPNPFARSSRLYRTGDVVRLRDDGLIEFFGRIDHQVKIRGYRVELGEIESVITEDERVSECVVLAREDKPGVQRLVAYVVAGAPLDSNALRERVRQRLAEYMVPSAFVSLPQMPTLPNGKLDRKALPKPCTDRPELDVPYAAPGNDLERICCEAFAATLDFDRVGCDDNFFELGGNSLLAMQVLEALAKADGHAVSAPTIFAHPTPRGLARAMDRGQPRTDTPMRTRRSGPELHKEPIAIIGMAGRFPGASSVESFWENLLAGRDTITTFDDSALDPSIGRAERSDPDFVRARGIVDDVDLFDAAFFGIPAREAEIMDPQHRIFLEISWECLERAGYAPDRTTAPVGVFAGVDSPTYMVHHLYKQPEVAARAGDFMISVGNDKDFVATRVAHRLNLKGPAIAVNTACSTSLTAVSQAIDSLRVGHCDMALAGGSSVRCPPASGYRYEEGAMLSPDGHTRTFDVQAKGTSFNDGAAVVLSHGAVRRKSACVHASSMRAQMP